MASGVGIVKWKEFQLHRMGFDFKNFCALDRNFCVTDRVNLDDY